MRVDGHGRLDRRSNARCPTHQKSPPARTRQASEALSLHVRVIPHGDRGASSRMIHLTTNATPYENGDEENTNIVFTESP